MKRDFLLSTFSSNSILDILIIGGGINGSGIAADASSRGLRTGLFDSFDFGAATSSCSSKLIHGGLRYLEQFEFKLVAHSLKEREILLKKAPHIVSEMRFILPHRPFLRSAWIIRLGLFLYDHLARRTILKPSYKVKLNNEGHFKKNLKTGFEYSDCWVDDARLVLLNAMDAKENGAEVRNYCQIVKAKRFKNMWVVTIKNRLTQEVFERKTKVLINAGGPWAQTIIEDNLNLTSSHQIRLIKGSHIVIPKINNINKAYILQSDDKRIIFAIPYLEKFTMIGTTDIEYDGDPRFVTISDKEKTYLLNIINEHFVKQIELKDIIWSFSGVRPLVNEKQESAQKISRDYILELNLDDSMAPLLSIFGGKITTFRQLSESVVDKISQFFTDIKPCVTKETVLPGGDFAYPVETLIFQIQTKYPWLNESVIERYAHQYGMYTYKLLKNCSKIQDMGIEFFDGLYQIEIDYLISNEFAKTEEDILWRRTKLGLEIPQEKIKSIKDYIELKLMNSPLA
ncbi:glycerol-3-phosphate dehydrogenase [Paraphotobacterium marinum]|uniref:Glycerol-3-phosphate dehydrogenase n=1 Tax=Paraphotobacterium marinum TaxID=1755811 RepID=A0A220VG80_9GAMM|nr:glycerol-3-phosphate dehydrogenase [Paraphotobacterium marinum]